MALPAAALIASTAFNYLGNKSVTDARGQTVSDYYHNLRKLSRQAEGVNTGLLSKVGYQPTQTGIAKSIFGRTTAEAPLLNEHLAALPGSSSAAPDIASSQASSGAEEKRQLGGDISRGARLNALSDVMFGQGIDLGRAEQDLSRISNFEQGNASVLPIQLQADNSAGGWYKLLGGLLGGAAQISPFLGAGSRGGVVGPGGAGGTPPSYYPSSFAG